MKRIEYSRKLNDSEIEIAKDISQKCGISNFTSSILIKREINSVEKALKFLNPSKSHFYDPFLLKNMSVLIERINLAKTRGDTVVIYGDYDADGICAVTILVNALRAIGIEPIAYIPERDDGYGLKCETIEQIAEDYFPDLFITVDCGVSGFEEVELLNSLGIDVIITDHHEVPEIMPNCPVINPKQKGETYPFTSLSGAGVALKVAYALIGDKADALIDLASVATIADSMPLTDENRDIVFEGLKIFNNPNKLRSSFKRLIEGVSKNEMTASTIAFTIAPRINASGRMGDAKTALNLFLTEDENEIFECAKKLNFYNMSRQKECDDMYKSAKLKLNDGIYKRIIVLSDKDWKSGFVGIVSAKLSEEYYRPVILFVENEDGILKGSARSIDEINIYDAINSVKNLTEEFGGHSQAAGVSIKSENLNEFAEKLHLYLDENYNNDVFIPKINCEEHIESDFSIKLAEELNLLEPYGNANKKPLFSLTIKTCDAKTLKLDSPHINFSTKYIDIIGFNGDKIINILNDPAEKTIIFEPNLSIFNRRKNLKGFLKDFVVNVKNTEAEFLHTFRNNILNLNSEENIKIEVLNDADFKKNLLKYLETPYGNIFLLNDINNLSKYPELENMQVHIYKPQLNNLLNIILLSPEVDIDLSGYKNLIYLDKPIKNVIFTTKFQKIVVNFEIIGYNFIKDIDISRESMIKSYKEIVKLESYKCNTCIDLIENRKDLNQLEFIIAFEVFNSLKLIKIENNILKIVRNKKVNLDDSEIYKSLISLK